jgi:glycosyltransferase involved in cell wall biosynthesis
MRVALVAPNFHPVTCGVGDFSLRLAEELLRRGDEPVIFSGAPASPHPEAPGVAVRPVAGPGAAVRGARIAAEVVRARPDLVLLQYTPRMLRASRFGSSGPATLVAALRLAGIPVRTLVHEPFIGWDSRPDLAVAAATQRASLAAVLAGSDRAFVTTDSRLRLVAPLALAVGAASRLGVVRVGANALPVPRRPSGGELRLGLFSTLGPGRRHDALLAAFAIVARATPARLILIGDLGELGTALRARLESGIAAHPFRDRIEVTGKLDLAHAADAVAGLDVYVFPNETGITTRSGTLPTALGSGVPVVGTRGPETDPLFVNGENVLFAESLDPRHLAGATLRVAQDAALRDRLSRGARRLHDEHLAWPRVLEAILSG